MDEVTRLNREITELVSLTDVQAVNDHIPDGMGEISDSQFNALMDAWDNR